MASSEEEKGIIVKFDNTLEFPEITEILNNPGPGEVEDEKPGDAYVGSETEMQQTKVRGILTPIVTIGSYSVPTGNVLEMSLKCDRVPEIKLTIEDQYDLIKMFDKPRPDTLIQLQILPSFDDAYKKIRLMFQIDDLQIYGTKIELSGKYYVSNFYDTVMKAYGETTTYEFFETIAKSLKLGFCSNLNSTEDKRWIYIPNKKVSEVLTDEAKQGGSERQILEWWIDYWNNINLVDVYERNNTIDHDITVWAIDSRRQNTESNSEYPPRECEAMITNNEIYRNHQLYVADYDNDMDFSYSCTDKVVEFYNTGSLDTETFLIEDGDVKNNVSIGYEYVGENFGEYQYLKQYNCRNMWLQKMNATTIRVDLFQPCLGFMKGHKVNFYWYIVNEFSKDTKFSDVTSNIDLPDDVEILEEAGIDPLKQPDELIIDKQVSGQYYIMESNLYFDYNGGGFNWRHELVLSRPQDQIEYFNWDDITINKDIE